MAATHSQSHTIWRIRLFDGPILTDSSGRQVRRFRSQKVGALLAYLCLHLNRACPREELCDALWPEEDLDVSANRLRVMLTSLRRQMEPSGVLFGTVIDVGTPGCIRLSADTVWCDTAAFERALAAGQREEAARLVRGTLLPGYYDEWVITARHRYEALCDSLADIPRAAEQEVESQADSMTVVSGTKDPPRHRLPLYLTRFFGREVERQQLLDLATANRLVTLTGPAGIGKTRLAVEAAREMRRPCIFVPLAELPDPVRVPEATLQALPVAPRVDTDPLEQLVTVLQQRGAILLILDNAEHLLQAVLALSLRLLEAVPELHLLVTSRHRLDVPGELILPLSPLEPPPYASAVERLEEFPSIALFLDRARNVLPDFVVTPRHVDALVEICRRLEGMPLALELAAAHVTSQTPAQIAAALAANLLGLKSRQRGLSERHRSLRAAIQGSYDLLPPELQRFFALLSVFQGGWTVEAAQAILNAMPRSDGGDRAAEFLEELTLRSLVVAREDQALGTMRYSWLESLRQFAAEQLPEADLPELTGIHADYFLTLMARVDEDDVRTLDPLDAEQENMVAALHRRREEAGAGFWKGLAGWLMHAYVRGHQRASMDWVEMVLNSLDTITDFALRRQVRYVLSLILIDIGRLDTVRHLVADQQHESEVIGDPIGRVEAMNMGGSLARSVGDFDTAAQLQRDALQHARALNNKALLIRCLLMAASASIFYGREPRSYGRERGNESEAARAELLEGESLVREMLTLISPHSRRLPLGHAMLVVVSFFQGLDGEAYLHVKSMQRSSLKLHVQISLMYSLLYECQIAIARQMFERAALCYGMSLVLQERMSYNFNSDKVWVQGMTATLHDALGQDRLDELTRQGAQMSPEDLINDRPMMTSPTPPS